MDRLTKINRWLESFVNPAMLGAAIAWWVQALGAYFDGSIPKPSVWALCFGLWFLVYYGTWYFYRFIDTTNIIPADYTGRYLAADLLDMLAIPVAFLGLGFATGHYNRNAFYLTWIAACAIPISALLHNFDRLCAKPITFVPVFVTLIVPIVALWLLFSDEHASPSFLLLGLFWIILIVYIFKPESFSSQRS